MIPWLRATLLAGFLAAAPPLAAHAIPTLRTDRGGQILWETDGRVIRIRRP